MSKANVIPDPGSKKLGNGSLSPPFTNEDSSAALIRLRDLIAPRGPLPVSKSTVWAWVKSGRFPQPVRIGRVTAWRVGDIRSFLGQAADARLPLELPSNPANEQAPTAKVTNRAPSSTALAELLAVKSSQ